MSMMDGLFPLGFYLGNAMSGYIKNNLGFMYNFALGMLFSILAMAYTYLFVEDSKHLRWAQLNKKKLFQVLARRVLA